MAVTDPPLTRLQDAIAAALAGITDLELVGFGHVPGGGMGFPYAFTELASSREIGQHHSFTEAVINIHVLYGDITGARDVQRLRDKSFTGTGSVTTSLRVDPTFGGLCHSSTITDPNRAIFRESAGYEAFGVTWEMKALLDA